MKKPRSRDIKGFALVTRQSWQRQIFRAPFQKFCLDICSPAKTYFEICPRWDPVFLSGVTSGRTKQSLWHVPLPHSSERLFVPSSWTFHRPVLDKSICQRVTILAFISELRYFGLSAFKCTLCFFGSWKQIRKTGLGALGQMGWLKGWATEEKGLFCRPGLRRKLCWLSPRPSCRNALARQQIINSPECTPSPLKTRIFFSCVRRTALHSYPGPPPQPHPQRAVIYVLAPLLGPRVTQLR